MDIFTYTDYRKFLQDWYEKAKAEIPGLNYRSIARDVGFKSPGHFTMIISGEANISVALALKFATFLKLKKNETDYFQTIVLYNQAKKHTDKKLYFQKLSSFRKSAIHLVDSKHYAFYDKWYHSAIRTLLDFYPFTDNYASLAHILIPSITPHEAQESIALMETMGFIAKDPTGAYKPTELIITTGYEARSLTLNNFVINSMELGKSAIDRFPKDERNISSLTIGISREGFEDIQHEIREFRRKILDITTKEKAEGVYQLSMQFFPLSKMLGKDEEKL